VPEAEPIVFVVDDDLSVPAATERLLRSVGFKVKTFGYMSFVV
jgi:FixJ family two-component response regulator